MPTTLKDIAAAAGVSIGTVERALKNRDRIIHRLLSESGRLQKRWIISQIKLHPDWSNEAGNIKLRLFFI